MPDDERDVHILHEDDVREVIQEEIETAAGEPGDAIANASTSHSLNSTFSDTEVESALNALGTKINSILDVLRDKGDIEEA